MRLDVGAVLSSASYLSLRSIFLDHNHPTSPTIKQFHNDTQRDAPPGVIPFITQAELGDTLNLPSLFSLDSAQSSGVLEGSEGLFSSSHHVHQTLPPP